MIGILASTRRRVQGVFFGWWIVLSACIIQSLNQGLLNQGFTIYFLPLQEQFGWSRKLLSSGYALSHVESGVLGPLEGWLADRFGPRPVVLAGVVLLGAGFVLLSLVQSIVTFFAAFLVIAAGSSLCGFLPLSVGVLNWFVRKRALALGIAMAGAGIGGVIVPVVAWSVTTKGWSVTALASGLLIWLVGIPMSLLQRHKPEKYGYLPDGDRPAPAPEKAQPHQPAVSTPQPVAQADDSFTVAEALRTRAFWLIALGHASSVLTVSAVSLHLAPHLVQQLDMSLEAAGSIVALLLIISMTGRVIGGFLADRINKRVVLVACAASHTVGILMLAYATSMVQVILFAIFHGLGWGARAPTQNAIRAEYFGRKSIGLILGTASVMSTTASIAAPIFAGWLADLRGDYRLAFTIIAAFTAAGSLFFALAGRPVRKPHPAAERAIAA